MNGATIELEASVASLGRKARRGPRTPYTPKDLPNVVLYFSAKGKRALESASKRTKQSRSTVIEYLIRTYAATLAATDVSHYRPRIRPNPCVSLTLEAKQLLSAAEDQTERSRSDIVESLVQTYGPRLLRKDFADL